MSSWESITWGFPGGETKVALKLTEANAPVGIIRTVETEQEMWGLFGGHRPTGKLPVCRRLVVVNRQDAALHCAAQPWRCAALHSLGAALHSLF